MVLPKQFIRAAGLLFVAHLSVTPAAAKITCCDVDGRRTCGDPPPAQCLSKSKTVFNKGGASKEVEAPLTEEQRAAREAAAARKAEEEKKAAEQERRDRALLASYSSESEIDAARDRALAVIEKNAAQAEARLDAALKRQAKLNQETEFYKDKPLPAKLQSNIRENELELSSQKKTFEQKEVDMQAIRSRYDTEKQRYRLLKGGGK